MRSRFNWLAVMMILAACVGFAIRDSAPALAASDTVTPRLVSITRTSASPLSPPGPLQVSFNATDDLNVRSVSLQYRAPSGDTIALTSFSLVSGVQAASNASLALAYDSLQDKDFSRLPSGTYEFQRVTVIDWSAPQANDLTCKRDGSATAGPVTSSLPASPCPGIAELEALDFTIENPDGDIAAATITSISLPTGNYSTGQQLEVGFTASDGTGAGLSTIFVTYENLDQPGHYIELEGNATAGTISKTLEENVVGGTYRVIGMALRDRMGYLLIYEQGGTLSKSPSGITAPTPPHTLDYSTTIQVLNANADTETPVLESFSRVGSPVRAPGDVLRINFTASDDTDIAEIFFEYDPPSGLPLAIFDLTVTTGFAQTEISVGATPGLYTLGQIRIKDSAGNEVRYFRGGGVAGLPFGVTFPQQQPAGMSLMFQQADFTLASGQGIDLTSLAPKSAAANSGQSFELIVLGSGFEPESVVFFGAASLATTFLNSGELRAQVTSPLLDGSARDVVVTVTTPADNLQLTTPRTTSLVFEILDFSSSDANCDGNVLLQDVILFRHNLVGFAIPSACDDSDPGFLDADRSGAINAADALYAMQVLAGLRPR